MFWFSEMGVGVFLVLGVNKSVESFFTWLGLVREGVQLAFVIVLNSILGKGKIVKRARALDHLYLVDAGFGGSVLIYGKGTDRCSDIQ